MTQFFYTLMWEIFTTLVLSMLLYIPNYILDELFEEITSFISDFYNYQVSNISEGIDEMMDSWSDSAGADETCDSSSTLVFGSVFLGVNFQGAATYMLLCVNPAADLNLLMTLCQDCILGVLFSLAPLVGCRTFTESINTELPAIFIPIFVFIEIPGQLMRVLSIALRMSANVTAGHNLLFMVLNYTYAFITHTVNIKYQFIGIILVITCIVFISLDFIISSVQSYVIVILETYYELDSE